VRSTKRTRRAPTGRASEKQKRSDLIRDRETSCPPASSSSPPFPPRRIHHLRIHLLPHPPSSRVSRLSSVARPSYPFLLFIVSLVFPCCSRASSRTEFIPPAKYPRVRLLISHSSSRFRFSPPSITVFSASERIFSFISISSVYFVTHVPSVLPTSSDLRFFESPLDLFFASLSPFTIFLLYSYLHCR